MPILDQFGREFPVAKRKPKLRQRILASRDAAQTTDDNRRHWENADSLSANAANDPATRQALRDRARYEWENNPHASGVIDEMTEAIIGTGPRLQITIPGIDRKTTRQIERLYSYWCEQTNYTEKLKVANATKVRDGEVFALEITNPALDPFLPQLDLRLYEAEQCATPFLAPYDPLHVDGIIFDAHGNPETYHLLRYHPGGEFGYLSLEKEDIPACRMRHWFRPQRPGQARGVTELLPSLQLFANMRGMTGEVMTAARYAACISGILYTDQAPAYAGSDTVEGDDDAFERVEVERGGLLTAPKGYRVEGFDPKQPFATFGEFRKEICNEIGRPTQTPGHIVSGDYSNLNYSSGRLANLPYHRAIRGRRHCCKMRMLNPNLRTWLREAFLMGIFDNLGVELPPIALWGFRWNWDGFQSVDPQKEAVARQTMLAAGLTTYAKECGDDGDDWEEVFEQRAIEKRRMQELGLTPADIPTPQQQAEADVPELA